MLSRRFLLALGLWCFLPSAYSENFWETHTQGWHWYKNPPSTRDPRTDSSDQKTDAVVRMQQLQERIKRTLDQAVLEPTPEHVKAYLGLQNQIAQQASLFSEIWQQVLLESPTLDYAIDHPTNQIARQVYWDKQSKHNDQTLKQLSQTMGLFFFFKGSCPYCHRFAPIVKAFADQFGFQVVPISLDGGGVDEFPHPKTNNGAANQFNVTIVPAVFLVNPQTGQMVPLAYGLTSEEELINRTQHIAQALQINQSN